jgi:SAM-dependent methyltransferase
VSSAIAELIQNKFLITSKKPKKEDLLDFYPLRVPETIYFVDGSKTDVAVERKGAHGEIDFEILPLDGFQSRFWAECNGEKTIRELAKKLNTTGARILEVTKDWVSITNQILRLMSISIYGLNKPQPQLIYKAPFLPRMAAPKSSADDVYTYHLQTIKDGKLQFERIESTVSHIYRAPHPILGWRSYGQALIQKINEEKSIKPGLKLLEIGGGMGSVSADVLSELKKEGKDVLYIIIDLSPALIKTQRELHQKSGVSTHHIQGNGEILGLKDSTIDVAISNEVIADFYTPLVKAKEVEDLLFDHEIPMSPEFFHCYRDAPEEVRVNLGAFMLLKELYRVLKPGGLAVVTEFGYQDRLPTRAGHLDHAEYSIQFSQMISVAAALGFNLYLTDAWDFLGFRSDVMLISGFSYQAAFRIMERHNIPLPNITYSEELFNKQLGEIAKNFRGISYVEPSKDPFKIVKFLICSKPVKSIPPQDQALKKRTS